MSKLKHFSGFINESGDDRLDRLRELGMAPKVPLDERWADFVNDWGADSEIEMALRTLKAKTKDLMDQYIYDEDYDSQEWDQIISWMRDQSVDDMGLLEFLVSTDML